MTSEERFARALLDVEPEKIAGGSKARRDWLGLMGEVQLYLHEHGYDTQAFADALRGKATDVTPVIGNEGETA